MDELIYQIIQKLKLQVILMGLLNKQKIDLMEYYLPGGKREYRKNKQTKNKYGRDIRIHSKNATSDSKTTLCINPFLLIMYCIC